VRVLGQPCAHLGMLVRVDIRACRDLRVDGVEEADELLVPMALHVAADNGAIEDIEGGQQGGGAMASVVMGHGAGTARLHWQAGLGAIESLDLALFVERQDHRMGRRIDVEAERRLMPTALASIRPVQWVASPDGGSSARSTTRCMAAAGSGRFPGLRVLSRVSPATPSAMNRACQRHTTGFDLPERRMISVVPQPSAVARMMFARQTCFYALWFATIASSRRRSAGVTFTIIPALIPRAAGSRRTRAGRGRPPRFRTNQQETTRPTTISVTVNGLSGTHSDASRSRLNWSCYIVLLKTCDRALDQLMPKC